MHKTNHSIIKRILSITLTALLVLSSFLVLPEISYAAGSGVKIGHAVYGEGGRLKGGKAGDKNGREVYIENWTYSVLGMSRYHWKYVLRCKDHDIARALASDMKAICGNNKIGYDQRSPDCTSLYKEAKANGWNISGINNKCETTCSNAISVCLNAEGIKIPKNWKSGRMRKDLMATGMFECFKADKYVKSSEELVLGDILIKPGHHAAMVVESDNPFTYKLTYLDQDGKTATARIEENEDVLLNPNNSSEIVYIKMDSNKDLKEEVPSLRDHKFIGWTKTGSRSFMACYSAERQTLSIKTKKVRI